MDLPTATLVEADRIIAYEMVHVYAQNTYYGDLTGDYEFSQRAGLLSSSMEVTQEFTELGENQPTNKSAIDHHWNRQRELGFKRPVRRRLSRRSFPSFRN